MAQPLVSIACLTYNHVHFIQRAIEGFLMQKTNFLIEILIHDDASTDGTTKILQEYQTKYPDKFFPIYQRENQYSKGVEVIQTYLFSRSRGNYIALCEGDDYWTDPLKLQKQVDFLEANTKYSGASHQSLTIFVNEINREPITFREHNVTDIDTEHLLDGRMFHTASLVFRSEIVRKHSWPPEITSGDRALFFLLTAYGKIYYSPEVMCCYRKHEGGMSNWVTTEMLEKDFKIVPWISKINSDFPKHQYYKFLHFVALSYPKLLSFSKIIKHSLLYIYHGLLIYPLNLNDLKLFIRNQIPLFLKKLR